MCVVEGISTLVVSYGDSSRSEQIESLRFDFLVDRPFTQCLPQIADGVVGDPTLRTILQLVNIGHVQTVRLNFVSSSGEPMPLSLNGEAPEHSVEIEIEFARAIKLQTAGDSLPLKVGYACVESQLPIAAQAIFQTELAGKIVSEAGIPGAPILHTRQIFAVEYDAERQLNTAIGTVKLTV